MKYAKRLPLLLAILLASVALGQGEPPLAERTAWIAYQSFRANEEGVWLMRPDGSEDHQIGTDLEGTQVLPSWSPDGTKVVFSTRGGETEPLYEYDLATGTSRQLFACEDPCLGDDEPVYSPDGTKVAFARALAPFVSSAAFGGDVPSDCGLWIGDIATGEVTQLTSNAECDREYGPRWSPDGARLAYWRITYEDGSATSTSVHVLELADGTEQRVTAPEMFAGEPDWSPDGEWLVFDTYPYYEFRCCQVSNLYRMRSDGSGLEQLTHFETDATRASYPRYTPDGAWIIFTAVTADSRSLWAIPAVGGQPVELVGGGIYSRATWQPTSSNSGR